MVGKTFCVVLQIVLNSLSLNKRDEIWQNQGQKKVSQNDAGVEAAYVRGCGRTILSFMSNRRHASPNREACTSQSSNAVELVSLKGVLALLTL